MSAAELACSYASLLLWDDGNAIAAEKITTVVKSAGIAVESYWPSLFAKLVEKLNIQDLIMNVGAGGGAVVVAVAPVVEEKKVEKEEPKEESDGDVGFSLFE